jgi:glycolate oxidase
MTARRAALPSIERLGRVIIEDIAVPRTRLGEAIRGVQQIARDTELRIFVFAHAGDGNLHPIIVAGDDADPARVRAQDAADAIFALALRLGGTLTAEHGIGRLKRSWVGAELGDTVHDLQRRLKHLFDPKGILNPGTAI